ncbi:MAG: inosine/xanthosine triphosphatase [Candidatus Roizmanbacteria bacterium]
MKVAIGSTNPSKIEAVRLSFSSVWPEISFGFEAVQVNSDVPAQPMNWEETLQGAINRAKKSIQLTKADYGVGLEGGMQSFGDVWLSAGWMVVINDKDEIGIGTSPSIQMSPKIMQLVNKGIELGEADDILFNKTNSKKGLGHFGLMTNGIISRSDGYKQGIIMALSRFLHPELY